MKKFKNNYIKDLLDTKTKQKSFSILIDAIIFLDKNDRDIETTELIVALENIKDLDYFQLLINDLIQRNYKVKPCLLYNSLWYRSVNCEESNKALQNLLYNHEKKNNFIKYLEKLIEDKSEIGYNNMSEFVENLKK